MPCRATPPPPPAPHSSLHTVQPPVDNEQETPIQLDPPLLPPPAPVNQQNPLVYRLRSCCLAEFVPRIVLTHTQETQQQQLHHHYRHPYPYPPNRELNCVQQRQHHTTCLPDVSRHSSSMTTCIRPHFTPRPTQLWLLANQLLGRPTTARHYLQQVERCTSVELLNGCRRRSNHLSPSAHHRGCSTGVASGHNDGRSGECGCGGDTMDAQCYRSLMHPSHKTNHGSYHTHQSASSLHASGATLPSWPSASASSPSTFSSSPLSSTSSSSSSSSSQPSLSSDPATRPPPSSPLTTSAPLSDHNTSSQHQPLHQHQQPTSPENTSGDVCAGYSCALASKVSSPCHNHLCTNRGALTIDATSPALTDTDNTVFLPDNGSDAHHGCCKDPLTTNSFALSSLTEKVSRRILELIDPSTSHLDSDGGDQEKQQLQLEAWTLNHDLVWPDGDYFKATKISMRQGVAQLKRGRRYVFVEPVLGPASSYLYPNPLSHTQQLLGSEEELDNVDDAVSGTELSMSYSQESQEQSEQELYNRQGNDEAEAEAAPKITSGRRESMLPSSMSQVSSGTSMSAQEAGSCHSEGVKAEKEEEEPYSPLLDPTVDGQDQFEYGLYELTYIGRIDQLSPKDFVPVRGRSFLVRLDENRPTLASPVPASSRAPECRCQLMMRKMVMQRELLQVRPAIAPVLTRAERQALREREAMLAQLQLRLQMRAQRAHAAGSGISGEGGYNRSRSNDRNTRIIRRPSLERSASEWYRHYGSGQPPSPRHQHHHHRQHRRGHHLHGRRHSTSSSTSLMSSSEASMPSICSTSELSAAIDSLSIDHDNGTSNHSSLSEEPSADGTQDTLMENSAMSGKGVDVVEEGAQSDASETDSLDESHWPGWRLYHRHHHDGYLPDDGRTRWVDHRRFEMTMTEIEQLERERDDEETEEYEEEEASVGNRYLNDYFGYADAGHRVASRTAHGSSRRRYVSPPPPLRTSSPPPEDSRSHPFLHHHHHSATSTSPATSYGPVTSSGEGDLSEYLTATTTMPFNQDYSDDGTSDATSSALASDESELDEDECELPMPAYLCPQQHHRHHHPWRIPFLGQSSLMPLSRLEENDADEENEDEYEYEDDDDNDTNEAAMRRGRRAQCCPSLPPPLLSPSLAPSFTSTLVQQRHRGMMYASDLDYSEDEDGEGDDEFEECLEEEKEEEVEETEKEYVEQQQQQQQQQYEEQPDELEARDFGPPSEMRRDRESAMYSYQMPNYQQQFRPRPVEDEAWWDPSPPEPSLLQASLQHRRTFVHPATNGARNHQHQHHHRPPRSAHSILGWTLEPISARA